MELISKSKVLAYQAIDNIEIGTATLDIVDMLLQLKMVVKTMVSIKDLPSCKKLTELSAEDIISKAKDLIKNDIIKTGIGVLLLGAKINDVVRIEDVKGYYKNRLVSIQPLFRWSKI